MSKYYQDNGFHRDINNQEGNIAMKSKRVQNIISNGALTAFDIWYNVDKELYRDDIFKELLEYVRSNDLKIKGEEMNDKILSL